MFAFLFVFQIRLTNGQTLTQTFNSKEQLSAVRLYVEMNRSDGEGPFSLMTNFPKKVFQSDDYEKPLDILGNVLICKGCCYIIQKPYETVFFILGFYS